MLTNSAHRLKHFYYAPFEENEDWSDMNDLAQAFGVEFLPGVISLESAELLTHPLSEGLSRLRLRGRNAVSFTYRSGQDLARAGGKSLVANLHFWLNLAEYAQDR